MRPNWIAGTAVGAINAGPGAVQLAVPRSESNAYRVLELPGLAAASWTDGVVALPPESALVAVEA